MDNNQPEKPQVVNDPKIGQLSQDINTKLGFLVFVIASTSLFAIFYILTSDAPWWL